jgi:hypothetical protein
MSELKPVAWQFFQDGAWRTGMDMNNHRENTEAAGIQTRDLYAIPEGYALVPVDNLVLLLSNFAKSTDVPRFKRMAEAMITAAQEEQQS